MEIYRGDIYYIEDGYKTEGSEQRQGRPAVVVSNDTGNKFSEIVSIVWLTTADKKPLPTHCEIMATLPSTALCEQVVTISQKRLGQFIRTATAQEMRRVDVCLSIALGIDDLGLCDDCHTLDNLKMKLEGAERELDDVKAHNDYLKVELEKANLTMNRAIAEDKNKAVTPLEILEIERENKRLRIMNKLLEGQNEKLIDLLVG